MKVSSTLIGLSLLTVVLTLFAAGVGLLYQDGGAPFSFATLHGQTVQIYGEGVYRYDTPLAALSFKMGDLTTLVLAIPLLLVSLVLYRRGSVRGGLLLAGVLGYFLYTYISVAFGAQYNNLFIVYLALLAASFFAVILALASFDLPSLPGRFSGRFPRRGIAIYLIVTGILLALIWLAMVIVPALLQGQPPEVVGPYNTFMTGVVDVGLVAPILAASGWLLLRRRPIGYLLASALLVFILPLGVSITVGGIAELQAGVVAIGQFIGMTASFTVLTVFALWFAIAVLRSVKSEPSAAASVPYAARSQAS